MKQVADKKLPTSKQQNAEMNEVATLGKFGGILLDIGWRLAVAVLGFLWLGTWLDKRYNTSPLYTLIGFGLIIASFVLIVRRVLQQIPRSQGGLKRD